MHCLEQFKIILKTFSAKRKNIRKGLSTFESSLFPSLSKMKTAFTVYSEGSWLKINQHYFHAFNITGIFVLFCHKYTYYGFTPTDRKKDNEKEKVCWLSPDWVLPGQSSVMHWLPLIQSLSVSQNLSQANRRRKISFGHLGIQENHVSMKTFRAQQWNFAISISQ